MASWESRVGSLEEDLRMVILGALLGDGADHEEIQLGVGMRGELLAKRAT